MIDLGRARDFDDERIGWSAESDRPELDDNWIPVVDGAGPANRIR